MAVTSGLDYCNRLLTALCFCPDLHGWVYTAARAIRSKSGDAPLSSKPGLASHLMPSADDMLTVGLPASPPSRFLPLPLTLLQPHWPLAAPQTPRGAPVPVLSLAALSPGTSVPGSHLSQAFAPMMSFLTASRPSPSELWPTSFSHSTYPFQRLYASRVYQLCCFLASFSPWNISSASILLHGVPQAPKMWTCSKKV